MLFHLTCHTGLGMVSLLVDFTEKLGYSQRGDGFCLGNVIFAGKRLSLVIMLAILSIVPTAVNIDTVAAPTYKTDIAIRLVPDSGTMLGTEVPEYCRDSSVQEQIF